MQIDRMSFYDLCNKAGFVKNSKIDKVLLAEFYGISERTVYRMIKTGTYHPMNIKLLKMQILNIELKNQIEIITKSQKYPFITKLLEDMNERKIKQYLLYPSIKKRAIKIALNVIIAIYKKLEN